MSNKHYVSKSAILLSLLLASGSLVQAEEITDSSSQPNTTATVTNQQANPVGESTADEQGNAVSTEETGGDSSAIDQTASDNQASPSLMTATATPAEGETKVIAPVEGQTVDVRILSTTDLHTNLVNYDYYQDKVAQNVGLAKTAVLIEEAKAENPNYILLDNGDTIQGTPLGTYKAIVDKLAEGEQHPMYTALEALGFDAGTLGNHEFNYGLDYLDQIIATAGLPLVNANVLDAQTQEPLYKTYEIISKTFYDTTGNPVTLNLGVTGIVPPQILNWDKAHLDGKVIVQDSVEALELLVPEMKKAGADLVIVLSHSGIGDDIYEKGEENVGYQIANIPGIDAVVTGHSHGEFPGGGDGFYSRYEGVDDVNGLINGTPVTMAGKYGDHLGVIDLNITYTNGKWQTNTAKGEIRKIDTTSEVADATVLAVAQAAHDGTVTYVRQQVGTTTAPINSYFALVKDDPSVQIVNNAQIWYAKKELAGTPEGDLPLLSAAAPFKAGGRNFSDVTNYTDIPEGPIAIKNVADLYLYDNVTAILKLTGADIKEWLEFSAGQFNQIDPTSTEPQDLINPDFRTYNYDIIDGVTYQFDVTQPAKYDRSGKLINPDANRVQQLSYQGQPIDLAQEFIVVSNNYRASGSFPGVVNASLNQLLNLENRQVIIDYIVTEKIINPSADNNWGFADTIKGLDLRFLSAEAARDHIGEAQDVEYLGASAGHEGFAEFKLHYVEAQLIEVPQPEKPVQDLTTQERQDILDMVREAYTAGQTATVKPLGINTDKLGGGAAATAHKTPSRSEKALPNTGSASSALLSLLGVNLLGTAGFFRRQKK